MDPRKSEILDRMIQEVQVRANGALETLGITNIEVVPTGPWLPKFPRDQYTLLGPIGCLGSLLGGTFLFIKQRPGVKGISPRQLQRVFDLHYLSRLSRDHFQEGEEFREERLAGYRDLLKIVLRAREIEDWDLALTGKTSKELEEYLH